MNKIAVVFIIVLLMGLGGCRRSEAPITEVKPVDERDTEVNEVLDEVASEAELNRGLVVEGAYVNDFFELEFDVPDDWTILGIEGLDRIQSAGEKIIESSDEALAKQLDGSEVVSLVGIFKYPLAVQSPYNASMLVSAEKLDSPENEFDGVGYLEQSLEQLSASGMLFEISDNKGRATINGQVYGTLSAKIVAGDQVIVQDYFVKITKGFVITIVMTYVEEEDKEMLRQLSALE